MRVFLTALAVGAGSARVPYVQELFHAHDYRIPRGQYRIPSLVSTKNGTLLAFVAARLHCTDMTPNIIYTRRSVNDGNTWAEQQVVVADWTNETEYGGVPVVDKKLGAIHYLFNAAARKNGRCSACELLPKLDLTPS